MDGEGVGQICRATKAHLCHIRLPLGIALEALDEYSGKWIIALSKSSWQVFPIFLISCTQHFLDTGNFSNIPRNISFPHSSSTLLAQCNKCKGYPGTCFGGLIFFWASEATTSLDKIKATMTKMLLNFAMVQN